jgi:catechol 2,3-dioxygenase-like lactoylglutathione lyase family enzyme
VTLSAPTGLHHVSFTVSDLQRSLAFYRLLGFAPERTIVVDDAAYIGGQMRSAFMTTVGVRLELREYGASGAQRPPEEQDVGSSHIALEVADIAEWFHRLSAAGVHFLSAPLHSDTAAAKWVFLLDPDGLPVELVEPDLAGPQY